MFPNKEGQPVPSVTFRVRENGDWQDVTTDDIFKGKTVAVFSLPGAFTPTCSSAHVPGYNTLASAFKQNGVDEIVCISVNDTFVMNEWAKDQQAGNVRFIPDGNGEFTQGMGLLVDKNDLGFGKRSWRYSMLVKDGIVEKMFIEPEKPGDPFEVSDAETMLKYLNPEAEPPKLVAMFTKVGCPFCARAKELLNEKGLGYEELLLGRDTSTAAMKAVSGASTTPQIFINGQLIGGSEALEAYFAS